MLRSRNVLFLKIAYWRIKIDSKIYIYIYFFIVLYTRKFKLEENYPFLSNLYISKISSLLLVLELKERSKVLYMENLLFKYSIILKNIGSFDGKI